MVVELGEEAELPALLSEDPDRLAPADGRSPVAVGPELFTLKIDPRVTLQEYLELQLPVRVLAGSIVGNAGFSRMLDAAPGWRALITLGKLWHLQSRTAAGRPRWPLLIVDAPSTGHSLSFLSVPRVVLDTVRLGPLRKQTQEVQALLLDEARTLVLPVSLAEELPVSETLELCEQVAELGMGIGPLFANAVEDTTEPPELPELLRRLAGRELEPRDAALLSPETIRACFSHRTRRAALQRGFIARLAADSGREPVELPYLWEGLEGARDVARLADVLEERLEGMEAP